MAKLIKKIQCAFIIACVLTAIAIIIMRVDKQIPSFMQKEVMMEFDEKFVMPRRTSAENSNMCKNVNKDPSSFWRSVTNGTRTHNQDLIRMNLAANCGAFNYTEVIGYNPRDPPFSWELDYLTFPPFRSMTQTVWANASSVELLNSTETSFTIGDKVVFKITLRTLNRETLKGGDGVHLWLINQELGASTAADVVDNKDGSYIASSLLPWIGEVKVKAAIDHPRDLFRTMFFIQRIYKTTHGFTGTFMNSQASESTPCSPFPAIQAFPAHEICNLTRNNGGFPWYCGKPIKNILSCSDWVSVRKLDKPSYVFLNEFEENLITASETRRPFLISTNITLNVQPSPESPNVIKTPTIKCRDRNLLLTFNDTNQSGYFFNKTWRPYDCQLPAVDKKFLSNCLKNTQVIFVGDSNSRLQMQILTKIVGCTHKILKTKETWHAPLRCDNDSIGVSIKYFPPKHPFYGSVKEDLNNSVLFSAVSILDDIPSTGNYLIHLHEFLHLIPFHLSLAEQRFHLVRAAIERLLARNARVHVIYQSAHTAYDRTPPNKHKISVFLLELQRCIFSGLGERVMFALTWPMTIAAENSDGHPKISNHFVDLYMGYVCERW